MKKERKLNCKWYMERLNLLLQDQKLEVVKLINLQNNHLALDQVQAVIQVVHLKQMMIHLKVATMT